MGEKKIWAFCSAPHWRGAVGHADQWSCSDWSIWHIQ